MTTAEQYIDEALRILSFDDEGAFYCSLCGRARGEAEPCATRKTDPMDSCWVVESRVAAALERHSERPATFQALESVHG